MTVRQVVDYIKQTEQSSSASSTCRTRYDGSVVDFTRRGLARDFFLLSFGLAGMNAADQLSCPAQSLDGGVIIYNRQKTASRRADEAEMRIRIKPQVAPLADKYRDPTGARLFRFHLHYRDGNMINGALNQGLKRMDDALRASRAPTNIRTTPQLKITLCRNILRYTPPGIAGQR